jgi:hypothetical protein
MKSASVLNHFSRRQGNGLLAPYSSPTVSQPLGIQVQDHR